MEYRDDVEGGTSDDGTARELGRQLTVESGLGNCGVEKVKRPGIERIGTYTGSTEVAYEIRRGWTHSRKSREKRARVNDQVHTLGSLFVRTAWSSHNEATAPNNVVGAAKYKVQTHVQLAEICTRRMQYMHGS